MPDSATPNTLDVVRDIAHRLASQVAIVRLELEMWDAGAAPRESADNLGRVADTLAHLTTRLDTWASEEADD